MTDPDYSLIAVVLDRSGSIHSIREDIEGGLNAFIKDQKEVRGRCEFMLAQFDDHYEVAIDYTDIGLVGAVEVVPRNSTALLDAIGKTIDDVGARLDATPEDRRPGHVILAIVTDGLENASRRFNRDQIFEMITRQRDVYGWEILFIAANQDAIATGATFGMAKGQTITYDSNAAGTRAVFDSLSAHTHATRSGKSYAFSDAERTTTSTTFTPDPDDET